MTLRLVTEYPFGFLNMYGGCIGSSEPTLVKMPHCWKTHVTAQIPVYPYHELKGLNVSVTKTMYCDKEEKCYLTCHQDKLVLGLLYEGQSSDGSRDNLLRKINNSHLISDINLTNIFSRDD